MNISRANSASNILDGRKSNGDLHIPSHQSFADLTSTPNEPVWRRRSSGDFKTLLNATTTTTSTTKISSCESVPPLPPNLTGKSYHNNSCRNSKRNFGASKNIHHHNNANYLIWITPVAASLSVAIIVAAISGPQWLFTEEKFSKQYLNGTIYYKPRGDDTDYITKFTKSSLWILCTDIGNDLPLDYHCRAIDYFPNETYSPDPIDSTNAIQYAITTSAPSLLVANFIHIVSYILLMLAMFSNKHTIYYFISGVSFIIAGLLMLIGIILYISIFKSEVGSKLKPKSALQEEAMLTYRYGYSFIVFVVGILLVFCSGLCNVFLYTSFHNETTLSRTNSPCFPTKCSNKVTEKSISTPMHGYVLRKDPNCNVHATVAKSLNQVYSEPAPDVAPFEFPCTVLTRSVSTLTDDLSPKKCGGGGGGGVINNMCGVGRSILGGGGEKTKKVKPREKDIYYIENDGDDDLSNVFVIEPIESFQRRRRNSFYEVPQRVSNHSLSDLDKIMATDYINFDNSHFLDKCGTKAFNSRTLPRNFAQKNFTRCEDNRRISASGIFMSNENIPSWNPYSILDPPQDYQSCPPMPANTAPIWPKIIINSPSHPAPPSGGGIGCANKYQRIRNNLNLKKLSNSLDNILTEDDDENGSPTFDLDRIERERRRSHASLFDNLTVFKPSDDGTPV